MTPALVKQLQLAYLEAGRRYADDSAGGSPNGALESGALMRIAAKRMREAEHMLARKEAGRV